MPVINATAMPAIATRNTANHTVDRFALLTAPP